MSPPRATHNCFYGQFLSWNSSFESLLSLQSWRLNFARFSYHNAPKKRAKSGNARGQSKERSLCSARANWHFYDLSVLLDLSRTLRSGYQHLKVWVRAREADCFLSAHFAFPSFVVIFFAYISPFRRLSSCLFTGCHQWPIVFGTSCSLRLSLFVRTFPAAASVHQDCVRVLLYVQTTANKSPFILKYTFSSFPSQLAAQRWKVSISLSCTTCNIISWRDLACFYHLSSVCPCEGASETAAAIDWTNIAVVIEAFWPEEDFDAFELQITSMLRQCRCWCSWCIPSPPLDVRFSPLSFLHLLVAVSVSTCKHLACGSCCHCSLSLLLLQTYFFCQFYFFLHTLCLFSSILW